MLCVHSKLVFKYVTFTLLCDKNCHYCDKYFLKLSLINYLIINTLTTIFTKSDRSDRKKPIIL